MKLPMQCDFKYLWYMIVYISLSMSTYDCVHIILNVYFTVTISSMLLHHHCVWTKKQVKTVQYDDKVCVNAGSVFVSLLLRDLDRLIAYT